MSLKARKLFYYFPWHLLAVMALLIAAGLVNLYSATDTGSAPSAYFKSQLFFTLSGVLLLVLSLAFHYRRLLAAAWPLYILSLLLLLAVVFFGKAFGGQKNWLVLGSLRLQPSEPAKLALILMLARYFHLHPKPEGYGLRDILAPAAIVALPLGLILAVKDVGSALFFLLIAGSFFFFAGLKLRWLLLALVLGAAVGLGGYRYFLSDYQRGRIQAFLHPEADPRGRGYHLIQSKIAVGSGRLLGKGYLHGRLNKLNFVPERHTDFVFPVLAEEWGFVGGAMILGGFGLWLLMMLQAAGKVKDPFGSYWILGMTALIFWQLAINLGGVLGLIPLAGVTLPFFSYGGSSFLTILLGMGITCNVYMRRYMF